STVVGIVGDAKVERLGGDDRVSFYVPLLLDGGWGSDPVIVARTGGAPTVAVRAVRDVIHQMNSRVWAAAYPLEAALAASEQMTVGHMLSTSATGLGLLALSLAALGLYS